MQNVGGGGQIKSIMVFSDLANELKKAGQSCFTTFFDIFSNSRSRTKREITCKVKNWNPGVFTSLLFVCFSQITSRGRVTDVPDNRS